MNRLLIWTIILVLGHLFLNSDLTRTTEIAFLTGRPINTDSLIWPENGLVSSRGAADAAETKRFLSMYGELPIIFEPNVGEADPRVSFISRGHGYTLLTSGDSALFSTCTALRGRQLANGKVLSNKCSPRLFQMRFIGANERAAAVGEQELPGKSNYFMGRDPERWHTNVPQFERVHYSNVYPGIDLIYYGHRHNLEYDFVLSPGATPQAITFTLEGSAQKGKTASTRIAHDGSLILMSAPETIRLQRPVAYQWNDGRQEFIQVRYTKHGPNKIGLEVGTYDKSKNLIIDPVLSYSSFLGGSSDDFGYAIAVDTAGNVYLTGGTTSADFPVTAGALQSGYRGSDSNPQGVHGDVFVSKLDPTGKTLLYSTYLGGTADDNAYGISVDSAGNAYLAGATNSADFPVTVGALQTSFAGGGDDAFVVKLNPTGSALVYSTYVGTGLGGERAFGLAVDSAGDAYITGDAAPDFPVTIGTFHGGVNDAYVAELNPSGSAFVFATFFGGNSVDTGTGITVDINGNVGVTGFTTSTDLPVTANAAQSHAGGGVDVFVAQFDKKGALLYCSYLGGTADDGFGSLGSIATDVTGSLYVTGSTKSADFPTTSGAFQTALSGSSDVFVAKIDPSKANSLIYSTLLGGSGDEGTEEFARGLVVDGAGNAIVTGNTFSPDFPIVQPAQAALGGGEDAFITKLNATGSALLFSTYLGGSANDFATAVAVDASGNAYVTGQTGSSNFPAAAAFQTALVGPSDAFVVRLADFALSTSSSLNVVAGQSTTSSVTITPTAPLSTPVTLTCSGGLPSGSTCTFNPSSVNAGTNGAISSTLTMSTSAASPTITSQVTITGTSGNTAHNASTSLSVQDFTISAASSTLNSINPGQSASEVIKIDSVNGFSSAVSLACSVSPTLPAGPTCSLNPSSVIPPRSGSITSTLTVDTTGPMASLSKTGFRGSVRPLYAWLLPVLTLTLCGLGRRPNHSRRKRLPAMLIAIALTTGIASQVGCGNNSSTRSQGTPAGNYAVKLTAAVGTTQKTISLNLSVQ